MIQSNTTKSAVKEIGQRRSKTITSIAVDAIEDMIISGELAAGDRINESALAEQLDISRGPIREACRSLEQAGLLTVKTNRGMYVREVSLDEARELYEVRSGIAGLAGELIVKRAADEELNELGRLVELMQVAADKRQVQDYYKLNLQFHDLLMSAAKNNALKETYHRIVNQLHLLRRRGLVQKGNLQVSNQEHRAIVRALADRDAESASSAIRMHVGNGFTRLIDSL